MGGVERLIVSNCGSVGVHREVRRLDLRICGAVGGIELMWEYVGVERIILRIRGRAGE